MSTMDLPLRIYTQVYELGADESMDSAVNGRFLLPFRSPSSDSHQLTSASPNRWSPTAQSPQTRRGRGVGKSA